MTRETIRRQHRMNIPAENNLLFTARERSHTGAKSAKKNPAQKDMLHSVTPHLIV
jgi:hypothetical protein